MDARKHLNDYVEEVGGRPSAAAALGMPYSTLAAICNGTRGIGKELAKRMAEASNGRLRADLLIWITPGDLSHANKRAA